MVDVKTEGKERETDDLKAKLEEDGKLCIHLRQSKSSQVDRKCTQFVAKLSRKLST